MRRTGRLLMLLGAGVGVADALAMLAHAGVAGVPWLVNVALAKLGFLAAAGLMAGGAVVVRLANRHEQRLAQSSRLRAVQGPTTDYVAELNVDIREEEFATRLYVGNRSVIFRNLSPHAVRATVNVAMAEAVKHYEANVASLRVAMDQRHVHEAALDVVLSWLYMYNMWRGSYPEHRDHPLTVGREELDSVQSHDQCLAYCHRTYGDSYRPYAAALLGMTPAQLFDYEKRREPFWNK